MVSLCCWDSPSVGVNKKVGASNEGAWIGLPVLASGEITDEGKREDEGESDAGAQSVFNIDP